MSKAASAKGNPAGASAADKRRTRRRPILETFSIFLVVPRKGSHRLQIHDLSEDGIGFDLDAEGESQEFRVSLKEVVDLRLYINQSLYIPLSVEVVRLVGGQMGAEDSPRRVGAEFVEKGSTAYKAFASFLKALDDLVGAAEIERQ